MAAFNPLELITGTPPSPTAVPLDAGTRKIGQDQYMTATDPNLLNKITAGSETGANAVLGGGKTIEQQAAGSGFQNPAMLQAIQNQYKNAAKGGISQVMKSANNQLPFQRDKMTSHAAGSAMAINNIEMQNNQMAMEAQFNAEIARAQVLSAILGGVGMGVGYKMANMKKNPSQTTGGFKGSDQQLQTQMESPGFDGGQYGNFGGR